MALDHGIEFLDNCWDYHEGKSELRMGQALEGRRDRAFLMTKLDGRTKQKAAEQLTQSLRRLRTDRIDLVQIHEVIRLSDAQSVFAPGGAIEALLEAKQAGKVRFIGFTGHKDPTRDRETSGVDGRVGLATRCAFAAGATRSSSDSARRTPDPSPFPPRG